MKHSLRPRTSALYTRYFRDFLSFCKLFNFSIYDVSDYIVILFIEFLASSVSYDHINNVLSGVKYLMHHYGLFTQGFDTHKVSIMLKAIKNTLPYNPRYKGVFTIQQLTQLCDLCNYIDNGIVYKCVFLFAFYGFFRCSNLLPHSLSSFNSLRHLTRRDIYQTPSGLTIILKWSKTMQSSTQYANVQLPLIPNSPICPTTTYMHMSNLYPANPMSPAFIINKSTPLLLTDSQCRKTLKSLVTKLGLCPSSYTFHAFRRSGAQFAFQTNVPIAHIKQHGQWRSDAIYSYLQSPTLPNHAVSSNFSALLTNSQH